VRLHPEATSRGQASREDNANRGAKIEATKDISVIIVFKSNPDASIENLPREAGE